MASASASEWVGTIGTGEDGTVVTTEPWDVLPPRLNRSLSLRKDSVAFWSNAVSHLLLVVLGSNKGLNTLHCHGCARVRFNSTPGHRPAATSFFRPPPPLHTRFGVQRVSCSGFVL